MNDTIEYDYFWFKRDLTSLIHQLKNKQFNRIIAAPRGGLILGTCLSHALNVRLITTVSECISISPKSRVLIVDDLTDSGRAMKEWIAAVGIGYQLDVSVATLLHNTEVELGVEHFYGTPYNRHNEKRYFDFWWEVANKGVTE